MAEYSKKERLIAKYLEKFPLIRNIVKYVYQRLVYVLNYSSKKVILDKNWTLTDPFLELSGQSFFGYYDKPSINSSKDILTHIVKNNECTIYIKRATGELVRVASTHAWNWQQGAMTTWLDDDRVCFNDIVDNSLVCHIFSLSLEKIIDTYDNPIQCYSAIKSIYASISYEKLNSLRPEYGYNKLDRNDYNKGKGITIFDINSGQCLFSIKLNQIIQFLGLSDSIHNSKVNHCLFSPDGKFLLFMYRAYRNDGKYSYLLLWDYKKNELKKLLSNKIVSHYSWVDNSRVIVWGRGDVETGYHVVDINSSHSFINFKDPLLLGDGHPSICYKTNAILTDTYPNKARMSSLFIMDGNNEERVVQLKQPWKFSGLARVDLHPRYNKDCNLITLDSGHSGDRRQYILRRCL